jgi:hypothetical protein
MLVSTDQVETPIHSTMMMNAQKDASKSSPPSSPTSSLTPLSLLKQFSKSFDESVSPLAVGTGWSDPSVQKISPEGKRQLLERVHLPIAIIAWYLVGVVSIVTTKVLLTDWQVPPLVVTFQQLTSGSCVLWVYLLVFQGGAQPWPWDTTSRNIKGSNSSSLSIDVAPVDSTISKTPMRHYDFILAGLFNALDFLASNTAFSQSAASFVETVKASEPITTTAGKLVRKSCVSIVLLNQQISTIEISRRPILYSVNNKVALFWKVDSLGVMESVSLAVLIAGVLLSTWANAEAVVEDADVVSTEVEAQAFEDSFRICATVMTANLCFAFRAMSQKFYRRKAGHAEGEYDREPLINSNGQPSVVLAGAGAPPPQMDDINLLCRMQQMGAALLLLPLLVFDGAACLEYLWSDANTVDLQFQYLGLAALNTVSFAIYK